MIRLKQLLEQAKIDREYVDQIANSMGETVTERLGSGGNGVAYKTASGRVLKITEDDAEVAVATRLRVARLYKHLANVYDVRPVTLNTRFYTDTYHAILMDYVTVLTPREKTTWDYIQDKYLSRNESDADLLRLCQRLAANPRIDLDFVKRILPQRKGVIRDFSAMRIFTHEAHADNIGWNRHGSLVHFDAWQREHWMQYQQRVPDEYAYYKQIGYDASRRNNQPYSRGLGAPVDVDTD